MACYGRCLSLPVVSAFIVCHFGLMGKLYSPHVLCQSCVFTKALVHCQWHYRISCYVKQINSFLFLNPFPADIDECLAWSPCHGNASCTNTLGSFTCACNPGYSGDGVMTCYGRSLLVNYGSGLKLGLMLGSGSGLGMERVYDP